jgi:hypothetical protein
MNDFLSSLTSAITVVLLLSGYAINSFGLSSLLMLIPVFQSARRHPKPTVLTKLAPIIVAFFFVAAIGIDSLYFLSNQTNYSLIEELTDGIKRFDTDRKLASHRVPGGAFIETATPELLYNFVGFTATTLKDGRVLLIGGTPPGKKNSRLPIHLGSAELYDPVKKQFNLTGQMVHPRKGHTATLLSNGKVLIAGGTTVEEWSGYYRDRQENAIAQAELYDPQTDKFSPTGTMIHPFYSRKAFLLWNGTVLLLPNNHPSEKQWPEIYDPFTGKFRLTRSEGKRWTGANFVQLANGNILLISMRTPNNNCGVGGMEIMPSELYNPKTESFSTVGPISPVAYNLHGMLLQENTILDLQGFEARLIDPVTFKLIPLPTHLLIPQNGILLNNGKALLFDFDGNTEIFDPKTRSFSVLTEKLRHKRDLNVFGYPPPMIALEKDRVLIFGGTQELAPAEIFESE